MGNLKIEYLQISDLTPYEKNARKHEDTDVQTIVASIKEFGFDDPIGVWGEDNLIVEGHGRLMAAKKLGMETVPVIHLDHLTDEQRRAYALAHNKTAEMSEWDFDSLEQELDELSQDFDMSEFGFELNLDENEPQEIEEDEIPEEVETRCKLGDIWQLGSHRLICGDSTDPAVIDRLMDGVKADCVFTDPPYGMKKESEGVLNDNLNYDDLLDFNRQW
ncbi:MAG: ParB N-terminal domain-containing protein, partial [Clostridia bacterium]|nr:ParB N-terminal domain-containing protein [Clostridia bacterium]